MTKILEKTFLACPNFGTSLKRTLPQLFPLPLFFFIFCKPVVARPVHGPVPGPEGAPRLPEAEPPHAGQEDVGPADHPQAHVGVEALHGVHQVRNVVKNVTVENRPFWCYDFFSDFPDLAVVSFFFFVVSQFLPIARSVSMLLLLLLLHLLSLLLLLIWLKSLLLPLLFMPLLIDLTTHRPESSWRASWLPAPRPAPWSPRCPPGRASRPACPGGGRRRRRTGKTGACTESAQH